MIFKILLVCYAVLTAILTIWWASIGMIELALFNMALFAFAVWMLSRAHYKDTP